MICYNIINNTREVMRLFTGFKLSDDFDFGKYKSVGEQIFQKNKAEVSNSLDKYFDVNGSIEGTKLQSDWFPQIECDIFLSHAHKDEDLAKGLAGWLYEKFGLKVFIDSCVWGYSLELQRILDNEYCKNKGDIPVSYDYQKVMYSTSHVHMMLSTALTMMLDKAESVFLLNTPNVISTKKTIEQTESPWLYHEIAMTRMIRRKKLSDYRETELIKKGYFNEQAPLKIKYDVDTSHLHDLNNLDLLNWANDVSRNYPQITYPLDILYKRKNVVELENI